MTVLIVGFPLWMAAALACEMFGHFKPDREPRPLALMIGAPFFFAAQAAEGLNGYWFKYTEPRGFWPGVRR